MPPTRHRNLLAAAAAAASFALVSAFVAPERADAKRETPESVEARETGPRAAAGVRSSEPRVTRTTLPGSWKADVDAATGRVVSAWRNIPALRDEVVTNAPSAAVAGRASTAAGEPGVASIAETRATVASARRVLAEWAPRLQLDEDGLANLVLKYERHGLARDVFVFQQTIDGITVLDAEIGVTLWNDEPIMIFSGYVPQGPAIGAASGSPALTATSGATSRSSVPSLSGVDAEARVRSELLSRFGAASLVEIRTPESLTAASRARDGSSTPAPPSLVWYRTLDDALALGYVVRLPLESPRGDWAGIVDAVSGEVVHLEDDARYATATGRVFHPNPVVTLQDLTLRDQNDADQGALDGAYQTVTLQDVERSQGTYKLRGPWVEILDLASPAINPPERSDSLFFFTRSQEEFEAVHGYYHIDRAQRYIQSLGFTGDRSVAAYRLNVDVHAGFEDNSMFLPSTNWIWLGDGCVDDAEDADVVYHEYGHAMQDDQVEGFGFAGGGALVAARSIGEGFGDYWSSTMAAQIGGGFDEAQVFDWDRNPGALCWSGRRVDTDATMDDYIDSPSAIYTNAMIWSGALWDIRAATGAAVADRLVIESHFGLDSDATFYQNATSLALADVTLYGSAHLPSILSAFEARGIAFDESCLRPDAVAPAITVGVLQNPLLTNYLDVVVHGSECLDPASVTGALDFEPLQFAQEEPSLRIFRAEHRISSAGSFTITVSASDLFGNDTTATRGFTATLALGDQPTTASSFDGALVVRVEPHAVTEATWVLVSDGAVSADRGIAYEIGPVVELDVPARVTLLRSPFGGSTEDLSISLAESGQELAASFDPASGSLSASLPSLGTIHVRERTPDQGASLAALLVGPASPNPSRGSVRFVLEAAVPERATLAVYSASGRLVRTLLAGRVRVGLSEIVWDGRDDTGRDAPSGVYFVHVDGERSNASRKVVLAR